MKKHQGKLSFTVEEGVGTTFCIELPVQSSDADAQQLKPSSSKESDVTA